MLRQLPIVHKGGPVGQFEKMQSLPLLFQDPTHNHPKRSHKWLRNSFFQKLSGKLFAAGAPWRQYNSLNKNTNWYNLCMRTKSMQVKRREETDHDMQGLLLKPASVTKDRSHDPKKTKGFKRINWKNEAIELGCKQKRYIFPKIHHVSGWLQI